MDWLRLVFKEADRAKRLDAEDKRRQAVLEAAANVLLERKDSRKGRKVKRLLKCADRMV